MSPRRAASVLLVDDHALMRAGLRGLITAAGDMRVVGQAAVDPAPVDQRSEALRLGAAAGQEVAQAGRSRHPRHRPSAARAPSS